MTKPLTPTEWEAILTAAAPYFARGIGSANTLCIDAKVLAQVALDLHPDAHEVESQLDDYITSLGGGRYAPVDLNEVARRALRRMRGLDNPKRQVFYAVPAASVPFEAPPTFRMQAFETPDSHRDR